MLNSLLSNSYEISSKTSCSTLENPSFKSKNSTKKLKNLQELVQRSGDTLYTPIIQTLVQLASEQNFSDQKILQAILKNLKELETNLRNFKAEKEKDLNVTLKALKAQEENLSGQLDDYHKLEQRYLSDVAEANQNTELLNADLLNLSNEITRKQEELANIAHLCETENSMFTAGAQRIALIRKDLSDATSDVISLAK